ncbi:hypothetical protein [Pectinatus brassicae]|uniref:Dolichyl-phosphate-mannose-protein mannosyltransferase n=1 Tax=Pectinatus brassicae TaxID=862415 RepID=A0A840UQ19_9FIRM|nr:hypothetical protein [Pectinatus brassicae]MBB5336808.1 hypothetical protein [Pectinatus brassicae]
MYNIFYQYILLLVFVLTFFGIGMLVFKAFSIRLKYMADKIFYASVLGCSLAIILFTAFYLTGVYSKYFVYIMCLAVVPGIYFLTQARDKKSTILMTIILVLLFKVMIYTVYPPNDFDATMYHLPIINQLVQNANIDFSTSIRYPTYPFFGEVFLSLGMVFGDTSVNVLSAYILFLLALAIGKEFVYQSYWKSIISVGLLFIVKVLINFSGTAYIDNILALFFFAAFLVLKNNFVDKKNIPIYLSGIFMGIAIGVKYTAGFCAIEIGIILLLLRQWKATIKYALPAIVIGSIWYIRTYLVLNNPLWPFMTKIFQTKPVWTEQDYLLQFGDLMKKYDTISDLFKGILHAEGGISVVIFLGLGLYCLLARKQKWFKLYIGIITAYFIMWYNSAQYTRYLMPIVPFLVLMATNGYIVFIDKFRKKEKIYKVIASLILCNYIIVVISFVYDYSFDKKIIWKDNIVKYRMVCTDRGKFLQEKFPAYNAVDYASKLPGKTYAMHLEYINYYGKGKVYGDWFGKYRYADVDDLLNAKEYEKLSIHLKNLKIDYLLVSKSNNIVPNIYMSEVYNDKKYAIYKIN